MIPVAVFKRLPLTVMVIHHTCIYMKCHSADAAHPLLSRDIATAAKKGKNKTHKLILL